MNDILDSLSPAYKIKVSFLQSACEHACKNVSMSGNSDWLALVSEAQKLVHPDMWKTDHNLILYILEQSVKNFGDNGRPSSTTPLHTYRPAPSPATHRPTLLSSAPSYTYHKRQELHEDAVSVVSDRSSTLPEASPALHFKNSGSLFDSAMWSFSLQNSTLIACMEDVSYNNIIRSSIAARASLQIDELDEDDYAVIARDSHLLWANQASIEGKTLIDWRPAGCWRTISTEVYVTNHADAPDMSAGKGLMNEVAEHRKSLENSFSHISHYKRQKKTEPPRLHHTEITHPRFRTGDMPDRSFNRYESYTRSQQLSIPDNPRQASAEMGREQTSHSDSDVLPHRLQNPPYFYPVLPGSPKLQPSVQDLQVQNITSLRTSSVPLDQREKTHRLRVPEAVYHPVWIFIMEIPLLIIFWWTFIRP